VQNPWPLAAALALAALTPCAHAQSAAATQQQTLHVDLPAGSLAATLNAIARQAGQVVSLDPALVQGKQAPAVRGDLSATQALQQALAGSGLELRVTESGNFGVQPKASTNSALELNAVTVTGRSLGTTTEDSGSYTTGALTIGKTAQSIRETPQSVTVMTRQVMDDKNLTTLDKVMAKTPGLTFSQRNYGAHVYQSRGFVLGEESYLMDGVPGQAYTVTGWLPPDMAIYDRVEVLRGASGLLVGAGNPGGAVNLVRKRPTAEPKFSITTRAGSWDNYRLDLDGSGKLNDAGTLRGRAVVSYEDKKSYLDVYESHTPLFYGIIEADLSDSTTVSASYRKQSRDIDGYSIFGLPRYSNGKALDVSRSTALVQDWNSNDTDMDEVFAEVAHRFNDNWSSTTTFTHSEGHIDQLMAFARGVINPVSNAGSSFRGIEFRQLSINSNGLDSHLEGNFDAFGLTHQVMVGANWSRQDINDKTADIYLDPWVPIDVFDPDHHSIARPARPAWDSDNDLVDERYGIYANARLKLAEPLTLILGARVSWYDYDYRYSITSDPDYSAKESGEVTPFAGLVYDLNDNWSWYASYADIFRPQSDYRTFEGAPLQPAIGTNYETGIKAELFDKQLNLSLAMFYIRQEDSFYSDPDPAHTCSTNINGICYLSGVTRRSKGIDIEASGEVLPGLQVLAGYTYNMTYSDGAEALTTDTPKHLAKVSTSYTLPGEWNRLTIGAGVQAQSGYSNETWDGYAYGTAGRAIWDARVAYRLDEHWTINLTGENLGDRKYYVAADDTARANIFGEPRNFMLTLRGDF